MVPEGDFAMYVSFEHWSVKMSGAKGQKKICPSARNKFDSVWQSQDHTNNKFYDVTTVTTTNIQMAIEMYGIDNPLLIHLTLYDEPVKSLSMQHWLYHGPVDWLIDNPSQYLHNWVTPVNSNQPHAWFRLTEMKYSYS